ncbi:MaoC/PaaZ C-terminal domain-containing protein [Rhizorhabdus dicambivorans]|uniref:3-alpha,7-alpha, 12-alpha-trihydroxy-5-beta-cholest-24-enoyl-CoA hydratase n=1 Tax=Rhizorhabdus dicambivorans TaxID=1850238 RepID=A0A2A4FR06_9SPHN|nr:MaoC/PaaZ C-terminal domain-containing protein [Rhizorhabdus dicambivorans]ATE64256.1 3-alpha,7-alpha,12-alpha-trihydroxy-5-beta-cholest-24-enoyl-CoA hydratase [Rhizorhabdus dicambivorans]PCE40549.1 3-alpha,7-alpha,12-alpha-trihydroxy-5-beta-cholest-24-enoyl-CoA hydratase [Rhizorhabdus dicambivorans]
MIELDKLGRWVTPTAEQSYDGRDCALYALAHGVGGDPLDRRQLDYAALPVKRMFPTMPLAIANADRALEHGNTGVDYSRTVLGEQSVVIHRPLPIAAMLRCEGGFHDVVDQGEGRNATIRLVRRLYQGSDPQPLATMVAGYVALGQGGFGGPGPDPASSPALPDRAPDTEISIATLPQAALLYDLTGDYVPFHVDPDLARAMGFERPILHGICTVGLAARAAMMAGCEDPRSLSVRLGAAVYPGDVLRFSIWRDTGGLILRADVPARGAVVIRSALASA